MSVLIIALPPGAPGSYRFVSSVDGEQPRHHGSAHAELLPPPRRGTEIVAVVPARLLSWHAVQLPRGLHAGSARLAQALAGLLEERLLQDPGELHLVLAPSAAADGRTWVAACPLAWLQAHLRALEAAGRAPARIVPEIAPHPGPRRILATGTPGDAWLLASGAGIEAGALALPLGSNSLALLQGLAPSPADVPTPPQIFAEPAVFEQAEELLHQTPQLQAAEQGLLQAAQSPWDLAQGALARSTGARLARSATGAWRALVHAPRWRAARWGLVILLLVQVLGLNLWARQEQQARTARQVQINRILTETFPQVQVVIDAPLQMTRELDLLRAATGQLSAADLEPLLATAGRLPGDRPGRMEFVPGQLQLHGLQWSGEQQEQAREIVQELDYTLSASDDGLLLTPGAQP